MKKFFTLVVMSVLALGANAQRISWTEDDAASAGTLDGKEFVNGDFKLKITDTDGKVAIDKNNAYFGTADANEKFTARLKSGGKSSSKNSITLTVPAAGTLKVYARTGSNSATDRNVVLTQNETELFNNVVQENDAVKVKGMDSSDPDKETNVYPVISVEVAAGEVIVGYPTGSINFYGFEFVAGGNTPAEPETWTVAGVKPVLDNSWDPSDENAEMKTTDGVNYTYVKEDIVLEKGTSYEFKIVKGHAWGEEYPSQNYSFTVEETAKYKVTISFNSETKDITVKAEKTGDAQASEHTYSVIGTINGNWDADTDMTKGNDGLYTAVFENVKAGSYKFKVRVDHDWSVAYPGSDYGLEVESDGSTVTITFNEENKEVNATVAASANIQNVKVLNNASAIFNLAGQQVDANYKGVVIMNGKKMIQK